MPTYVYKREDGTTFEIRQRITEDALATCPDTGQAVERVIQPAASHFKGSGFYLTDYVRKEQNGNGEGGKEKKAAANGEAPAKNKTEPSTNGSSKNQSAKTETSAAE